jgi:polar amino acid transport system substrate-binding protein
MALVCALALAFALLLPLLGSRADGSAGGPPGPGGQSGPGGPSGPGTARGPQARAERCDHPQDRSPSPADTEGAAIRAIKARGYLVVGVDQNSYRWGYRNPNDASGELEGFDIDLAHAIAKDLLHDEKLVQFRAIPTNERITAVEDGRVDMVVRTMTITCKRLEEVAFSAPYFLTGQQVLAPKTSPVNGYGPSLAGRRICSADGSTAHDRLVRDRREHRLPASADISTVVPNQLDCLVRLQLGEVDAVVTDGALAASQAAQDPTVELKGRRFTTDYYGVAMNRKATDLVRRVNLILEDYRRDGGWKASYDKWLAPTLGRTSESATPPVVRYR